MARSKIGKFSFTLSLSNTSWLRTGSFTLSEQSRPSHIFSTNYLSSKRMEVSRPLTRWSKSPLATFINYALTPNSLQDHQPVSCQSQGCVWPWCTYWPLLFTLCISRLPGPCHLTLEEDDFRVHSPQQICHFLTWKEESHLSWLFFPFTSLNYSLWKGLSKSVR